MTARSLESVRKNLVVCPAAALRTRRCPPPHRIRAEILRHADRSRVPPRCCRCRSQGFLRRAPSWRSDHRCRHSGCSSGSSVSVSAGSVTLLVHHEIVRAWIVISVSDRCRCIGRRTRRRRSWPRSSFPGSGCTHRGTTVRRRRPAPLAEIVELAMIVGRVVTIPPPPVIRAVGGNRAVRRSSASCPDRRSG